MVSKNDKQKLKRELVDCLKTEKEIRQIIIFGSFLDSADPNDLDVAVFQDSDEQYLDLAMKYRKKTRDIAKIIPLDIIPIKNDASSGFLMDEIRQGETIYERRN